MASEPETSSSETQPEGMGDPPSPTWEEDDSGPPAPPKARPWGPWATIGLSLFCIFVMVVVQGIATAVYAALSPGGLLANLNADLNRDGNCLAAATLASTPVVVGLVVLLAKLRGCSIRDYFALDWPPAGTAWLAAGGMALLLVGSDALSTALGRPIASNWMIAIFHRSMLPFLLFALVILAPLEEETLFRGFFYKGIAESRAGPITAILVVSVVFALLHVQYDWYDTAQVLASGLYLGLVRWKARSLPLLILLHAMQNATATLEVYVQEHWLK